MVPLPVLFHPELIPIQSQLPELVEADQGHPLEVITFTLPEPASCPTGEMVYEHIAPCCVIVNVWPATVSIPVRVAPVLLGSTK
jgi:hypothetical protein